MADPISFTSKTPRLGLPFLFAGQAQKEFFVNEAYALVDLLLHPAIENEVNDPPSEPEDGSCWLVGSHPTSQWTGQSGNLAGWYSGNWLFVSPREGMRVLDKSKGQLIFYSNEWQRLSVPAIPSGGQNADIEARAAIGNLLDTLRSAGILPAI